MASVTATSIVYRYYDVINQGDLDALEQLVAPGYQYHAPGLPPSFAVFKQMLVSYRLGFSDLHHHVEQVVAEGDRVVVHVTSAGTHSGVFLGHPPTQRRFAAVGIDIFRLEDDLLAERWGAFDTLTMLQQLGLYRPIST